MSNLRTLQTFAATLLLLLSLTSNFGFTQIQQLETTVKTDKTTYTYRQLVEVSGNLTLDENTTGGLVGVEVNDPNNHSLVTRTISVGNLSSTNVEILSVTPCDETGKPKMIFEKNNYAHVNVTIRNNDSSPQPVLISICVYDGDQTPISPWVYTLQTTILPRTTIKFKPSVYIESWVSVGPAVFYVNVFSDWLKKGGYPLYPEKSAQFNIGTVIYKQTTTTEADDTFKLNFRLPPQSTFGTYTVKVTAYTQEKTSSATTTFNHPFQLIGDVNFDHVINILDLVMITIAYGSKSGDAAWKPHLDINPNGVIDIQDIVTTSSKYGATYSLASQIPDYKEDISQKSTNKNIASLLREKIIKNYAVDTGVDIYTQHPDGYNGKGLNMPSDMFWPEKDIIVYACAAYKGWPEQLRDVTFELVDPYGITMGIFHNRTDQNGMASIKFRLPSEDLEYYFGTWTIVGTVNIAGIVYSDILTFKYDYHARIWCDKTVTDKTSYKHQEMINLTIKYGTFSMQLFPAIFLIKAFDESETQFAYVWIENTIGNASYCAYANGSLTLNIYIPKNVAKGEAKLYIDILGDLSCLETLCPSCTLNIQIEDD